MKKEREGKSTFSASEGERRNHTRRVEKEGGGGWFKSLSREGRKGRGKSASLEC